MHLRRSRQQIEYVLNKDGTEVDFLATRRDGNRMLVQASWSISAEETREREFRALNLAMDELGMDDATVVTAVDPPSDATTENGTIHVLPAWRWFLSMQELCL
jgi:predicted AAA+ superfamily ATPase